MIIKKNSWHYRMNVWKRHEWRTQKARTLCGYFWFTVGTMLLTISVPFMAYLVLFILGGSMVHDMRVLVFIAELPTYWNFATYPLTGVVFICGILAICACLFLIFWAAVHTGAWVEKKLKSRPKKEKTVREPGLLASYLKARKEKVCPIIKFEE